jgi:flagella basal body P-ring formation protein FlgA
MIRGDVLRQKVRLAIQSKMSHALDKVAEIRIPRVPDVRVPEGATARVRFEEREDFSGAVDATILIEDGPLKVSTRRVNANIDLYTVVLTVRDELHRGHQISPKDLIPLQIAESKVPRDAVYRAAFVAGAEVRRRIRPGQPIRQAWFKIPPVVKRGQRVRLVALRGAIRISTMGEALNNAVKGGFVRVRNVDSRKIVTGRATQSGTVEMEF